MPAHVNEHNDQDVHVSWLVAIQVASVYLYYEISSLVA